MHSLDNLDRWHLDSIAHKHPKSAIRSTSPWEAPYSIGYVPNDWDGSIVHGYAKKEHAPEEIRSTLVYVSLKPQEK